MGGRRADTDTGQLALHLPIPQQRTSSPTPPLPTSDADRTVAEHATPRPCWCQLHPDELRPEDGAARWIPPPPRSPDDRPPGPDPASG